MNVIYTMDVVDERGDIVPKNFIITTATKEEKEQIDYIMGAIYACLKIDNEYPAAEDKELVAYYDYVTEDAFITAMPVEDIVNKRVKIYQGSKRFMCDIPRFTRFRESVPQLTMDDATVLYDLMLRDIILRNLREYVKER